MKSISLNIAYYTRKVFFLAFSDATDDDYMTHVSESSQVIYEYESDEQKVTKVRYVMLDDEYLQWLQQHFSKNTLENQARYMNSLSDSEVLRLWEKHQSGQYVESMFIPVVLFSKGYFPSSNISFSSEFAKKMETLISETIHMDSNLILVHPSLMRLDYYEFDFMPYFDAFASKHWIEPNLFLPPLPPALFVQEKPAEIYVRLIPVTILMNKSAILYFDEEKEPTLDDYSFNKKSLSSWFFQVLKSIGMSSYKIYPLETLVYAEDLIDFYQDIKNYLNEWNPENL